MVINKAKTTHLCDLDLILILCVCFEIVTDFTKYFYADFSGSDRWQSLRRESASGGYWVTRKTKKTLFICGMAKS